MTDTYGNIHDSLGDDRRSVDLLFAALDTLKIEPKLIPMRGGTDGAALSARGLPTPNFFTGGCNFHSRFEFLPVPAFVKSVTDGAYDRPGWRPKKRPLPLPDSSVAAPNSRPVSFRRHAQRAALLGRPEPQTVTVFDGVQRESVVVEQRRQPAETKRFGGAPRSSVA